MKLCQQIKKFHKLNNFLALPEVSMAIVPCKNMLFMLRTLMPGLVTYPPL